MTRIVARPVPTRASLMLEQSGVHPLLARLYAARGVAGKDDLDTRLAALLPPDSLKGAEDAARLLADAIAAKKKLLIVADYDCDGATACAVGLRALRMMGATVDYLVPNRFETGYGLSPEVVRIAAEKKPDVIVTVDNGIASVEGVAEARRLGIATLITDHHLPGDELPDADVIVNPNQPGCRFPSKSLAGVGVMFYVMLALRAELRRRGAFGEGNGPNLGALLDLVALGTVADVVPLDRNNRILVAQGLARIREGRMQPGLKALFRVAGREPARAATFDLGFAVGPRINAAGRLGDMSVGIECLATDDEGRANNIAQQLDAINRERREIEAGMREDADLLLEETDAENRASLVLFDPEWHQGVIGILAGRVKEKLHRPTFAFARGNDGEVKGSGRSIPGLHLRDALDLVAKHRP
ncbi:partial Single-stranded-DNA-specific exonuclease RecJ, partial [Rhodocyclaceae bacterium]